MNEAETSNEKVSGGLVSSAKENNNLRRTRSLFAAVIEDLLASRSFDLM
jgi:hypothetical protein